MFRKKIEACLLHESRNMARIIQEKVMENVQNYLRISPREAAFLDFRRIFYTFQYTFESLCIHANIARFVLTAGRQHFENRVGG
jgi:hypothetical protein